MCVRLTDYTILMCVVLSRCPPTPTHHPQRRLANFRENRDTQVCAVFTCEMSKTWSARSSRFVALLGCRFFLVENMRFHLMSSFALISTYLCFCVCFSFEKQNFSSLFCGMVSIFIFCKFSSMRFFLVAYSLNVISSRDVIVRVLRKYLNGLDEINTYIYVYNLM